MFRNKKITLLLLAVVLASIVEVANADYTFGEPTNLGPTVNSSTGDVLPTISANGLTLYFNSNRPGGAGGFDIWVTTRATISEPWGEPVNLGPTVNTTDWEYSQSISADGLTLYFMSTRPGGTENADIWVTTRATTSDPWDTPVNLGPTVNSSSIIDWAPSISADGLELYFASERPGDHYGGGDIYVTTRETISDPWGTPVNLGIVNTRTNDTAPSISADG